MGATDKLCAVSDQYLSTCCGVVARVLAGRKYPPCPKCGKPATWVSTHKPPGEDGPTRPPRTQRG